MSSTEKGSVRAVERALDILLALKETDTELGLSDLAKRVELHKSTVHRLLVSLESRGFIRRNESNDKYRLGFGLLELVAHVIHSDDLASLLLPEMVRLRDQVGETISLYIREGNDRIRVQAVESNQSVRRVVHIGQRLPLYVGASGRILLMDLSQDDLQQFIEDPSWPEDINRAWFLDAIEHARSIGYAVSIEEREAGASAIAVPVYDKTGHIVAALSVSGPVLRFTNSVTAIAPAAKQAASRMTTLLG